MANFIFTSFYNGMKILQTNNYSYQQRSFKTTYPVVHRIVSNGTYIPVSDHEIIKKLQGKLIRTLNSNWNKIFRSLDKDVQQNVMNWTSSASLESIRPVLQLPKTEKEALAIFRGRFGFYDTDYAYAPISNIKTGKTDKQNAAQQRVRSFYNREKGLLDGRYYLTYMISGKDIQPFEQDLAKNIGKTKHDGITMFENAYTQEAKDAIDLYNKNGLEYVNAPEHRLKSKTTGMTYILRANFEPIKNKAGKIKDYKFISAKFVPEYSQPVK